MPLNKIIIPNTNGTNEPKKIKIGNQIAAFFSNCIFTNDKILSLKNAPERKQVMNSIMHIKIIFLNMWDVGRILGIF